MKRCTYLLFAALGVAMVWPAVPAAANLIEIQFTGVDLVYDGTDLYDAAGPAGRNGNPAQADPLTTMVFLQDGVPVGTTLVSTDGLFLDVLLKNVPHIPLGGMVLSGGNGNAFGFDVLIQNALGLSLNVDTCSVAWFGNRLSMAASGVATEVQSQDLPFGLSIDPGEPVSFVVSSNRLANVTTETLGGTEYLTGFTAPGTGSVSGTLPEPATLALAAFGATYVLARRRARAQS
jgi:hypothetical protein